MFTDDEKKALEFRAIHPMNCYCGGDTTLLQKHIDGLISICKRKDDEIEKLRQALRQLLINSSVNQHQAAIIQEALTALDKEMK